MLRNAFAYITRKWPKSLLLFAIILLMGTLSLIGLSMKGATQQASSESLGSITNSFSMQINRRTNPGTPRGAGNLRGEDIEKISQVEGITSSIKRINAIADILDHEIIETEETLQNQSPERAKHFKNTLMVTGVNDSSKEDKICLWSLQAGPRRSLDRQGQEPNPHARRFGEKEWSQGRR